jgi:simple sugar transport system ATP-binding protein
VSGTPALALRGIHKRFGATEALRGASLEVRPGTVHALLGENGAGKSTLMRIAFGLLTPDAGTVEFEGHPVQWRSSAEAIRAGIGMVHQHFMLVPAFTVAENAALGDRRYDPAEATARVRAVASDTGLAIDPQAAVGDLPVGAQQRAEIVRALAHDASLLILDEPTAVLSPTEGQELYRWVRTFAARGGTVVLITHRLADVLAVADDVTVLRQGETVLRAARDSLDEDRLIAAVVGEVGAAPVRARSRAATGEVLFALRDAELDDARGVRRLHAATLEVRAGEVLGVVGVEGSGHRELLRLLAGRLAPTRGTVVRPAVIGFVPEDRLHDALIPAFTLTENVALAGAGARTGLLPWPQLGTRTNAIISAFDVRSAGAGSIAATLSGGNQQRFVVGRERMAAPRAIVAENPTRGLDVRSAARVLDAITAVADAEGGAAIVYSSDLDEVVALTSRVIACSAGRVVEVPPPADPGDRAPYARAMMGLSP